MPQPTPLAALAPAILARPVGTPEPAQQEDRPRRRWQAPGGRQSTDARRSCAAEAREGDFAGALPK